MSAANETITDIVAQMREVLPFTPMFAPERAVWYSDHVAFVDRIEAAWKRAHDEAYATYKRMDDALEKCECVIMCATRFIQIPEWSSVRDCDWDGALRAIREARQVECAEPEGGQC